MAKEPDLPRWSWIVSLLGLIFVLGSIGYMFFKVTRNETSPPDIVIHQERVTRQTDSYLVEVRVANHGGSAAARLILEAVLLNDGEPIESSSITIEYVPAESSRKAGLLFTQDPRLYQLKVRALGYEEP
jgi:uncharacterized protein (TIGR02588 family)